MPIPRLRIDDAALIVIDMQEKLVPTIFDAPRVVANCATTLRIAGELGVPYVVTEHYPQGLGRTVEPITSAMLDPASRVEKTRFSASIGLVTDLLQAWRRTHILICGVETHVCVAQTVLDLQTSGRQCYIVSDAVGASQPDQIEPAFRRMEAAGAVTTGVMSSMFELLGDATHPSRRACVELAKVIVPPRAR